MGLEVFGLIWYEASQQAFVAVEAQRKFSFVRFGLSTFCTVNWWLCDAVEYNINAEQTS